MKANSDISKISAPFYDPPPRKTSAEIINEARLAIRDSQMGDSNNYSHTSIKPIQTQRPFTPRDKERLLFGKKTKCDRPPSSFSLSYLQKETDLPKTPPECQPMVEPSVISKPLYHPDIKTKSTNFRHQRSNSVSEINDKIFNIGVKEPRKIKLPSLDHMRPLQKRKIFKNGISLDNLPEESGELPLEPKNVETRNAFSSPQERTSFDTSHDYSSERPKQKNLSECLLLGPQNLSKIFDNRQIVENSESLFIQTGYLTRNTHNNNFSTLTQAENKKEKSVENILNDLSLVDTKKYDEEHVKLLLSELYDCMEKENLLGSKINSKMKIKILKNLYKFVESKDEQILINIALVILGIKVTGNNLSGVCKLIFKVSKNDRNDHLFFQKNLLESFLDALGRSSPIDDAEACIYGYGAVKFLTMNQKLLLRILDLGILQLMVLHIKIINNARTEKSPLPGEANHVLFQLTGALRNLVSEEDIYSSFISCGTITQLCQSLELFSLDLDVVTNISRTLSTISSNDCCCDSLVENQNIYKTFIMLFQRYAENEEVIVRLTYTLGNIVAKIDNTRVKYFNEENSVDSLLNLWKLYLERTLQICSLKLEDSSLSARNSEDVMIKVIRVIANIAINPEIGKAMNEKFGDKLIEEFLKVLISNPFKHNEELVLSVLSTLNNLSYYYSSDLELDVLHVKQVDIVEGITEYTKSRNKECVIETMRILGNLSRSKITRNYVAETEVFPTLIKLLDKADLTLLKTTVGVFVNLMSDNKSRMIFKKNKGVSKMISILTNYCENDWLLGTFVCQMLWNYCIDTVDLYELMSESEIQQLLVLLADYLDEEKLFGVEEQAEDLDVYITQEYLIWEEFANVATNLLEKIEYFLDTFDQIVIEDKPETKQTKDSSTNITFTAW